jgi:hypothetical protein
MQKSSERQAKYDALNTKQYRLKLNIKNDNDIMEKLAATGNMQGYIKQLIRKDIALSPFLRAIMEKGSEGYDLTGFTQQDGQRTAEMTRRGHGGNSVVYIVDKNGSEPEFIEKKR